MDVKSVRAPKVTSAVDSDEDKDVAPAKNSGSTEHDNEREEVTESRD